jgi:hypothetical protein
MSQARIKIITLFVVGLLLGPAYHLYCSSFTGENTHTSSLDNIGNRWILDDKSIFRISEGLSYKPFEVPLSPMDNNVRLDVSCLQSNCPQLDGASISISNGAQLIFQETININTIALSKKISVGPISIPYPEKFMVLIEPIVKVENPSQLTLSIIKNVTSPSLLLIWIGYGLTFLPLLFLAKTFIKKI